MTGASPRLRVRPRIVRWSVAAFVVLLPFVVHSAWDYLEARRLRSTIDAIRSRHEPVTLQELEPYHRPAGEAERYYRAAAALASRSGGDFPERLYKQVREAEQSDRWPADLTADIRDYVDRRDEALRLLDRAIPLAFDGFPPGTDYNFRTSELMDLAWLAGLRTTQLTLDGDGDRAANSLATEIRLAATVKRDSTARLFWPVGPIAYRVRLLVERTRPTPMTLARLADAMALLDEDRLLKQRLMWLRANTIEAVFSRAGTVFYAGLPRLREGGFWWTAVRPWFLRLIVQNLEIFNGLIAAAEKPWPTPLDAAARVAAPRSRWPFGPLSVQYVSDPIAVAQQLGFLRCIRAVIAVERYRREHGERAPARLEELVPSYLDLPPVDPFSGAALRFRSDEASYVVYSVGSNRRDDGGRFNGVEPSQRRVRGALESPSDFGIRVNHHS